MLQEVKANSLETSWTTENFSKEIEDVKENQLDIEK